MGSVRITENSVRVLTSTPEQVQVALTPAAEVHVAVNQIGLSGGDGGTFIFTQDVAAATWDITHNLGRWPSVTAVNSAGEQVLGGVEYLDENSLRVTFAGAFAGKAYLN